MPTALQLVFFLTKCIGSKSRSTWRSAPDSAVPDTGKWVCVRVFPAASLHKRRSRKHSPADGQLYFGIVHGKLQVLRGGGG